MSKRKKHRKQQEQLFEEFAGALEDAQEDALDFIETATPFEISETLAEMGASTVHRAGIESFLKNWQPNQADPGLDTPYEALVVHWLKEIEHKRGPNTVDMEDDVLLLEIARYFWFRLNSEPRQEPA